MVEQELKYDVAVGGFHTPRPGSLQCDVPSAERCTPRRCLCTFPLSMQIQERGQKHAGPRKLFWVALPRLLTQQEWQIDSMIIVL